MRWLLPALLLFAALPAAAQQSDEQTEEHEAIDRGYLERLERVEAERKRREATDGGSGDGRQAYRAKADELIRDLSHRLAENDHYRVQTDDPRLDVDAALRLIDTFRGFFEDFWSNRTELKAYEGPAPVFLFYSYAKYNQLLEVDFGRRWTRPKGHYHPSHDTLALHTDTDFERPEEFADTLVHEAAHQLIDQRMLDSTEPPWPWIDEGLASYFGYTKLDKSGRFLPGEVGGKRLKLIEVAPGEAAPLQRRGPGERQRRLDLAAAGKSGRWVPFSRVVSMDRRQFYGGDVGQHYATAWVLCHFLLHGDGGSHVEPFVRYLELVAKGRASPEALYELLGMDAAALDEAALRHAKKLR